MAKDEKHKAGLVELPTEQTAPMRRFRVVLRDCPVGHVTAADGHEAERKYRKYCGILKTANEFEVSELSPEQIEADRETVKLRPGLMGQIHEIP